MLIAASAWRGQTGAERAQLGGAAHHAVDEKAMHDRVQRTDRLT